jgi:hypothetical protein
VPDIATILEVAGVDTRHQQKGKLLCPKCDTYHITVSHRKGIAKCWACNWTRTEDYVAEPYERNWVVATLNNLRDDFVFSLRQGSSPLAEEARKYLKDTRKIDWRVISCAPIGMVPAKWDTTEAIEAGKKALMLDAKLFENEPDPKRQKKLKADFDAQKALFDKLTADIEKQKHHVGWLTFAYENHNGDCIAIELRKISKAADGSSIIQMIKPLENKGVFNPQISGDCLGHDGRVLLMEGPFNQLRFLSECAREADKRGEDWEQWIESSVTLGSSAGQDIKTLRKILENKDAEPDIAVVMHDNDPAGVSAAHNILDAMNAQVFTTPDPSCSDLDELFNAKPPSKVLGWLQKQIGTLPLTLRPVEAVRQEVDKIRYNDEKLPGFKVEEAVVTLLTNDLKTRATYIVDTFPYIWLPERKKLIRTIKDSQPWYDLLEEYGLLRRQTRPVSQSLVAEKLEAEVAKGKHAEVHKLLHSTDSVYLNGGQNRIIKITTDCIEYVDNGTDDVYFDVEPGLQVPEFDEDKLPATPYGVKLNRSPLCNYLNAPKWDERAMSGQRMQQLFMARVIAMFLFHHIRMWPILIATGEQDSGKTSLLENIGRLFYGADYRMSGLPAKVSDIIPTLSSHELCFFNNTDNVDLEEAGMLNIFCNAVFDEGHEVQRQLWVNNVELRHRIRTNVGLTARNMNFNRSDAMRRSLVFALQRPDRAVMKDKVERRDEFLAQHSQLFHELLARVQQTLMALKATKDKRYVCASDMQEFERFTLRVADHEGWLNECKAIWEAFQIDYKRDIVMGDPLVMILRLWLGSFSNRRPVAGGNANRAVSPATLWAECEEIRERLSLKQTYASAEAMGRKMSRGDAATMLATIGYQRSGRVGHPMHKFVPTPAVLADCIQEFADIVQACRPWDIAGSSEARKVAEANDLIESVEIGQVCSEKVTAEVKEEANKRALEQGIKTI